MTAPSTTPSAPIPTRAPATRARQTASTGRATVVLAFGGNALLPPDSTGTAEEQTARAVPMARAVAQLCEHGHRVVLTHGNGPQVGNLALQQEEAAALVAAQPLSVLGAMTAGQLGHLLALLVWQEAHIPAVAVLTHVVVDPHDPAFHHATKPIGPFYAEEEARRLSRVRGWQVGPDASRGYRRLVPSPMPRRIVELEAIQLLMDGGHVVIALGGGGVPVMERAGGALRGIEAVIDKDSSAALLATSLGAEMLVLVTGVDLVAVDFGTPRQRPIDHMTVEEAEGHLRTGQFPAGSMGPKVSAAVRFLRSGGQRAFITSPEHVAEAVHGEHGTVVTGSAR
jgi:carbamate kinase